MRLQTCIAASLAAIAALTAGGTATPAIAQSNAELPVHFIGRPTFQLTSGRELTYGIAFGVTTDDGRSFLLTALHAFGPRGGLGQQIASARLPESVISGDLYTMDFAQQLGRVGREQIRDGYTYGSEAGDLSGDLAAFVFPGDGAIETIRLAPSDLPRGADAYLIANGDGNLAGEARICPVTIVRSGKTGMMLRSDETFTAAACSGAPLVDVTGRLAGMALTVSAASPHVVIAMPVSAIRTRLSRSRLEPRPKPSPTPHLAAAPTPKPSLAPAATPAAAPTAHATAVASAAVHTTPKHTAPHFSAKPVARPAPTPMVAAAPPSAVRPSDRSQVFVGRPLFQLKTRQLISFGTGFGVRSDGGRNLLMTPLHVFGPQGGVGLQMRSDHLNNYLKSGALRTIDGRKIIGFIGSELITDGYTPAGDFDKDLGGDLAVFDLPANTPIGLYTMATLDAGIGSPVHITGKIWNDRDQNLQSYSGTVVRVSPTLMEVKMNIFFAPDGFDGAPVLDGLGQVVGMVIRAKPKDPGRPKNENVFQAIPISAIRTHLRSANVP